MHGVGTLALSLAAADRPRHWPQSKSSPRCERRHELVRAAVKVESVTQIDAPPELVWGVTVDLERWPEWTPTTQSVKRMDQGKLNIGSAAIVKQPGLPEAKWVVTAITPGECFTWETRIRGIRMIATHQITATHRGAQCVLRVELSGLVARLLWPLLRFRTRRSLEQESAGLKKRCEA